MLVPRVLLRPEQFCDTGILSLRVLLTKVSFPHQWPTPAPLITHVYSVHVTET